MMNFSYDYGTSSTNTGRVLSRTDAIQPEHSQTYTYDSVYRLSSVVAGDKTWSLSWTFDVWGNRTAQTPQGLATSKVGTQTSGYANNRNTSFTYDAAGNQTNDGSHSYTFSAENQITQMDGGAAVYGYDGEGRRMKKTVGSETTYYFYGPGGLLCEFSTVAGTSTATTASASDRTTYRTSDKLGSAVLLITSAGSIVENNRTLPYGESWLSDVNSVNDKKFTTYQRDSESGLDYAMDRFYGNNAGRFQSPDRGAVRLTMPMTLNRYIYGFNDPINNGDPTGREPCAYSVCVTTPAPPPPIWIEALFGGFFGGGGGGGMSSLAIMLPTMGIIPQPPVPGSPEWQASVAQARTTLLENAARSLSAVSGALHNAASLQNIFSGEQLDCISGIETGRTWAAGIVARNGRVGLFQFNEANWEAAGTDIPWDNGNAAKDPGQAAAVALALLYRKLGYSGVQNPTEDAIRRAIDNFGEGDGRYGQAVMDCANQMKAGNFAGVYATLEGYAQWVAGGRR
jgi:RHS repeat-associated protein